MAPHFPNSAATPNRATCVVRSFGHSNFEFDSSFEFRHSNFRDPASSNSAFSIQRSAFPRRGFTLIEMIVVISIIVLAMTLAIPAIRSLTGSRSTEAAENTISSLISYARTEAISLQRTEGLLFYIDTGTDRVNAVLIAETPRQGAFGDPRGDPALVKYFDIVPDHDPFPLPAGIRIWTMKDTTPGNGNFALQDMVSNYRYLGFNNLNGSQKLQDPAAGNPPFVCIPGGVILFNAAGRLVSIPYGFRYINVATGQFTGLGALCFGANGNVGNVNDWPMPAGSGSNPADLFSQIGLVIFDREIFLNQTGQNGTQFGEWNNPAIQPDVDTSLDLNTTPIFVNRYSGNLMRAE